MKRGFFYLCASWACLLLAALISCGDAKDEAAVSEGKVTVNGALATKAEISDLIDQGEHLDVKWGKEFETNRGDFRHVYINGHRCIMWLRLPQDVNSTGAIFEDGDCPKCKRRREADKQEIIDSLRNLLTHFNMGRENIVPLQKK